MWVGSPFDDEALAWDDAVEKARTVVAALREASRASGGSDHLVALLGEIRTSVLKDEEFVAALGCAAGHGLITRLVGHPDDDVAAAAGDAMCACVAQCPPGSAFPSRGEVDAPHFSLVDVGTLRRPLALRLRHVREPESMGGEGKKSIPNIVWPSGVVLARWLARHPELVKDAEVLEMGAGLGAPGMTAAAFGARRVVLTDADPAAVRNMAYNARQGAAPLRLHAGHQSTSHGGGASAVAVDAIATRCTAAVLDWHAKDDLLPALGANTEAPACDVDGTRAFDVILGADVVHEEGMVSRQYREADGVVRCLAECLSRGNIGDGSGGDQRRAGVALICNPAPAHRVGAVALPGLLSAAGLVHVKAAVTSPILRCGMEEETEDVALELYAVARLADDLPALDDVGDQWVDHV